MGTCGDSVGMVLGHVGMGYGVRTHRDIRQSEQIFISVQLSGNTGTKHVLPLLPSLIALFFLNKHASPFITATASANASCSSINETSPTNL